jgi:predicted alpha/beta-fold hydrolase
MLKVKILNFKPFPGFSSKHLQTILPNYLAQGKAPATSNYSVILQDKDCLSCEISTPLNWLPHHKTVVLVHGIGGAHTSSYMVRLTRKFYEKGIQVVRVNLRGVGSGFGLSKLPYHAGVSFDVLEVLKSLKKDNVLSDIYLIGFSLGGNVILKLAGELGEEAPKFVKTFISVSAPIDLERSIELIENPWNKLYHRYFVKNIKKQGKPWITQKIKSLSDYDNNVTAPIWGFKNAKDYYDNCSSLSLLSKIKVPAHLVFSLDDPFVCTRNLKTVSLPENVNIWVSKHGGHMGYLGSTPNSKHIFWMDQLLLNWVDEDYITNCEEELDFNSFFDK